MKCKNANKPLVVAGCVPQGSHGLKELEGISIIGVQQIDRVVEVVEETLKGHEVRLLSRKTLPSLDLPKVQVEPVRIILTTIPVSFSIMCTSVWDFLFNKQIDVLVAF
jgi:tRNA A37 methylthiotransferase MiaB